MTERDCAAQPSVLAHAEKLAELLDLDGDGAAQVLGLFDSSEGWEAGPLSGVLVRRLAGGPALSNNDAGLMRLEPGVEFPMHRHLDAERVLLLAGGYRELVGSVHRAGELLEMAPDTIHAFTVLDEGPCLLAMVLGPSQGGPSQRESEP